MANLNQEQTQQIINLRKHSGWIIVEDWINKQIEPLRSRLENDRMVIAPEVQAELRAYRAVLRLVKGVENNAK